MDRKSPKENKRMPLPRRDLLDSFECVDVPHPFVCADPYYSRKSQRVAAGVAIAFLNAVKRDFNHDGWLHETEAAEILDCVLLEIVGHFEDLAIRKPRICLSDVQQLTILLHGKGVVG